MNSLPFLILLVVVSGILAVLLIPVSLRFDSRQKRISVEWLRFSVTRRLVRKKRKVPKERSERETKRTIKAIGRFFLSDRDLFLELCAAAYRFVIDLLRSVSVRKLEVNLSTTDPMWNGVISGVLANVHLENVSLAANFQTENHIKGWLQLYPYKLLKVSTGLLFRLPYRRMIRTLLFTKENQQREE